uniref:Uncharacterized protein n=1 Tax=viral metagenome TaxID=1070528 RepID=A0A6C0LFA8_9ZZZZ
MQQQQYRFNRRSSNFDELRKNETTSRAGLGWETGEEERVLSMRLNKASFDEIASELKRTSRSIQTRIYQSVCKSVETENEDESSLIAKYDLDGEDFILFKTQRQEKLNKFESRKNGGEGGDTKPYRKPRQFDGGAKSQYTTPYENKTYSLRNELNTLRQEVYELRRIVNDLK